MEVSSKGVTTQDPPHEQTEMIPIVLTSCSPGVSNVVRKLDMPAGTSKVMPLSTANEIIPETNGMIKNEDSNVNEGDDGMNVDIIEGEDDTNTKSCEHETKMVPNVDPNCVPVIGMQFDSDVHAYRFYSKYALMGGFDTRIRDSKKNRDDVLYFKKFVCKKDRLKKQKGHERTNYASTRCFCKASMSIQLDPRSSKWRVCNIQYAHNHYLHSPSKITYHESAKKLSTPQKNVVETVVQSEVRPSKVMDAFAHEAGGMENVPFSKDQLYKHINRFSNRYYGDDAQTMVDYFKKKNDENQEFYFNIQYDEIGEIGNCFWVDAIAREDYYYFGDVVMFDRTYKKNKYHMPLAVFTGVNHHYQNITFGCALLIDEKINTFKWLFETWLHCMGGQAPVSFLTDQDLAIRAALKEVFPNTLHRCCNWHIHMKVPTYVGLYRSDKDFKHKWDKWFFKSDTIEEFESRWEEMNLKFPQLHTIDWATNLWQDRKLWAQPYFNDTFMAGMSMTQHNEIMNHYFQGWFNEDTSLSDFVMKYEDAVTKQRHGEKALDFKMNNEVEPTSTRHALEVYLRDTFTPKIFREHLKNEFLGCIGCCINIVNVDANGVKEYRMDQSVEGNADGEYEEFTISYNPVRQCFSSCRCKRWESMGIVCCHMLTVLNAEHRKQLPSSYVLKRWTRCAKKGIRKKDSSFQLLPVAKSSLLVKKKLLMLKATRYVNESFSDDTLYEDAVNLLDKQLEHIQNVKMKKMTISEQQSCIAGSQAMHIGNTSTSTHDVSFRDCQEPVHAKGTTKRYQSGIEQAKLQRICATCKKHGHDSRTCSLRLQARNSTHDGDVVKQRICKSCGGTGHDKRNCLKLKQTGGAALDGL